MQRSYECRGAGECETRRRRRRSNGAQLKRDVVRQDEVSVGRAVVDDRPEAHHQRYGGQLFVQLGPYVGRVFAVEQDCGGPFEALGQIIV